MMQEQTIKQPPRPFIPTRRILLPTEHGSWSFLFEPLVVGTLLFPSLAAPWLVLMAMAAFFTRQPLKTYSVARANPAGVIAGYFVILGGVLTAVGLAGAVWSAGVSILYLLIVALPLAFVQMRADVSRQSRALAAELTGAAAAGSSAAMIAVAGGSSWDIAASLWLIVSFRFVSSILYVRSRLLLEKGKAFDRLGPITAHATGLLAVLGLALAGMASMLTAVIFAVLLVRCVGGLSPYRSRMKAMKIGIWEVIYGTLTIVSIVLGYYLGV